MIMPGAAILGLTLLLAAVTPAVAAIPGPHHVLDCGGTSFTIDNRFTPSEDLSEQVMTAGGPNRTVVRIDLDVTQVPLVADDSPPFGPATLISAWSCHNTRRRIFLEIAYVCSDNISRAAVDRYCNGSTRYEWSRYLDLQGRRLDPGYAIEDPRYVSLRRRLGLPHHDPGRTYELRLISVY